MKYEDIKKKYSVKEQYLTVDEKKDIKIFVRVITDKKKKPQDIPTVIIPGGPGGDASFYFDHIEFLIKYAPLILFDPRGTGKSNRECSKGLEMEDHIDDLEIMCEKLGFEKVNIYGTSYGAMVAAGYAIRYQSRISKLLLGVGAYSGEFIAKAEENLKKYAKTEEEKKYALDILYGRIQDDIHFQKAFKNLNPLYSTKVRNDKKLAAKFAEFKPGDFDYSSLNKGFSGFLRKFDYSKNLKDIKVPTLIFAGKYDWICDPSFSYHMHQEIENSELYIMNGGHNLMLDCTKEYKNTVKNFLDRKL